MVMAPQFWKYTKNQWVVYLIKKLKTNKGLFFRVLTDEMSKDSQSAQNAIA